MPFTVRLANNAGSFIVMEHETILEAALRQGFEIPYSCGEGICGSCEGQIIDGFIDHNLHEHFMLDETDLNAGKALFCSAKPRSDLMINAPGIVFNAPKIHHYLYQKKSLRKLSQDVFEVILIPQDKALHYLAGQYVNVKFDHEEARPFSIANIPNAAHEIHLHVRVQANNPYAHALIKHLENYGKVSLSDAQGHCLYHPRPDMPALFLAIGTGFAPLKAILETAFQSQLNQPLTLYWAGKYEHDLYWFDLAKQWQQEHAAFKFVPILLGEQVPETYQCGNILDIVLQQHPNLTQHHIYLAGPPQLTIDAMERFMAHQAKLCYMYSDAFDFIL